MDLTPIQPNTRYYSKIDKSIPDRVNWLIANLWVAHIQYIIHKPYNYNSLEKWPFEDESFDFINMRFG